jgi:hypothetical protein
LDRLSPGDWGEDFAAAWSIAVEMGKKTGHEPVVLRLTEREWQQLHKNAPGFCEAPIPLQREISSSQTKKLFRGRAEDAERRRTEVGVEWWEGRYFGYHFVIVLTKPQERATLREWNVVTHQ